MTQPDRHSPDVGPRRASTGTPRGEAGQPGPGCGSGERCYVVDAKGGFIEPHTSMDQVVVGTWCPGCSRLAYQSELDGNRGIYVINADGTGETNLTASRAWDSRPCWSPDTTRTIL